MKNMKKSVYVFWGIAAFGVLGAILSIPNLQNMLIYFALIVVFGALGYWQFRKGQTEQPAESPKEKPEEKGPEGKEKKQDKPTAKTAERAAAETKAAQLSSVNEIDYGFHSDDDYDYWKVTVTGVTFKNGRKSRQTILKKIFFRDEPFNKDECHSCTLRRGEYEGEPSFAVCVHDDIIGFIPREKVQYFYDNFYRCDGITTIRVFSEHDIIGARVVVRFRRNADETSKDAPQEVTTKAVLETSNSKAQFWSDDEVESEDNAAADETAAQPAKTEAADKPASVFFGQVVVTEGEFRSFTRRKLNEILREKGAIIESTITVNTDFYIVGDIPLEKLDSNCLSSNGRKLERLLDKGECYATELDEDKLLALLAEE